MRTFAKSLYLGLVAIFVTTRLLHAEIEKIANESPRLHLEGDFPSTWAERDDGTTALLFKGKLSWKSGDASLKAESSEVTVEPSKGTVYKLLYATSDAPLAMEPNEIAPILQEIMQNRITAAYAIDPTVTIREHGRITLSAKEFVFCTSLTRKQNKQNKTDTATPNEPSE